MFNDGKVVGKLGSLDIVSGRVFGKEIWKCFLRYKIIDI